MTKQIVSKHVTEERIGEVAKQLSTLVDQLAAEGIFIHLIGTANLNFRMDEAGVIEQNQDGFTAGVPNWLQGINQSAAIVAGHHEVQMFNEPTPMELMATGVQIHQAAVESVKQMFDERGEGVSTIEYDVENGISFKNL